jgi:hypothetical protein
MRQRLAQMVGELGTFDLQVVELSMQLDGLINEYYRIRSCSIRRKPAR